jgi:hypothetical protein
MINVKPLLVIYFILKENKTHYKVSHFPSVNSNPFTLPIAAYLSMCKGGGGVQCGCGSTDHRMPSCFFSGLAINIT